MLKKPHKWLPVLILLVIHVFVPVAEGFACDDCSLPQPGSESGHQGHCSICSGASLISSYDLSACCGSVPADPELTAVFHAAPAFPINKPPQN